MSAYIEQLKKLVAADRPSPPTLRQQFLDWFRSMPEVSRNRPYAMAELEQALGTQGKYIGTILTELGWERARRWSSKGQYHRYWVPPKPGR